MSTTGIAAQALRGLGGSADFRPVASYGRISKRKKGDGGGAFIKIEIQHSDNTEYIATHFPGAPVAYYSDNLSAWDPDVIRPDWERMLSDLKAGNLRACVAWHADRYTRQPIQLETMWGLCKETGTQYHTLRSGHVTNPLMLRIEGALAANDSDLKSEKISRRHKTLAEEGKAHGGRRRFGYTKGMAALDPVESEILRDVCERFIGGETLYSLAKELEDKGITGTGGAFITGPNLRKLIGSPHIAGLRVHKTAEGTRTFPAVWPHIISEADHILITEMLSDPKRRTSSGGNARVHMLAGVMVCDECRAPLRGRPTYKGEGRAYACQTGRHCYRPTYLVDKQVELIVIDRLSRMNAAGVFRDDEAAQKVERLELARKAIKGKRAKLAADWAAGLTSDEAEAAKSQALDTADEKLKGELSEARASIRPLAALEGMTGPKAPAHWKAATIDKRVTVIRALFESLSLVGADHGRKPFAPEDVRYVWRELPGTP